MLLFNLMKTILLFLILTYTLAYSDTNANLTSDEKQYIKNHPTLNLGAHKKWMPFSGVNEQGEYIGVMSEYMQLISTDTGFDISIDEIKSFNEYAQLMENGELDILISDLNYRNLKS